MNINRMIFTLLIIVSPIANAYELTGNVVAINDGDTIKVIDVNNTEYKVRLNGIDAPEKNQPFGTQSKKSLSAMVYMKNVTIYWHKYDRYRRIIGKVLVDGKDVNLEQIKNGMAWHYKKYQNDQLPEDRIIYNNEEVKARNYKIGLWFDNQPIAPWEFRKTRN